MESRLHQPGQGGRLAPMLAAALIVASTGAATAASPTVPPMSCAGAVAAFERDRVVMVRANGRAVVPLRVGTPINLAAGMQCGGRGQFPRPQAVATTDQPRCVISLRC